VIGQLGNGRCMYSAVLVLDLLGIMGLVKSKIKALPLSEIAYVYINTAHHAIVPSCGTVAAAAQ